MARIERQIDRAVETTLREESKGRGTLINELKKLGIFDLVKTAVEETWGGEDTEIKVGFPSTVVGPGYIVPEHLGVDIFLSQKTKGFNSVRIQYGYPQEELGYRPKTHRGREKELRISGVETTFEDLIPEDENDRQRLISEALKKAFMNPKPPVKVPSPRLLS